MKVNDVATLSMSLDTVFLIGGYSCFRDTYSNLLYDQENKTQIIALVKYFGIE